MPLKLLSSMVSYARNYLLHYIIFSNSIENNYGVIVYLFSFVKGVLL